MRRRGGKSCAGCSILLAFAGVLYPAFTTSVEADILDAMPAFVSRTFTAGLPHCGPSEELCPVSPGSNDLHCVDLTDPKTCGGCVIDGEGLDCTSVPDVFMQQCTSRGQCTGCRWKHGGMNASLEEPDFLSCSIILTQPVQASRHKARRVPQLTFAKQLIKEKIAHIGPMPARKPKSNHAADQAVAKHPPHRFDPLPGAQGYPGIGPGAKQIPPQNIFKAQRGQLPPLQARLEPLGDNRVQSPKIPGQLAHAKNNPGQRPRPQVVGKRNSFPPFELEDMPEPPHWLTAYTTSQLSNLPLTDSDDAILGWFQSIENGISKLGVRFHAMAPQEQKKKISNADRFRLKLPPVPPKKLVRPNKPAPFILPGMDYTEEEIEALGLQNYIKTHAEPEEGQEEIVTIHDTPSVFWGRLMRSAFTSTPRTVRKDVMDALWFLLDTVSRPPEDGKKPVAPPKRAKPEQKVEKHNQFLPKGDAKFKPAAKYAEQNAFIRPGQMAAQKAGKDGSDLINGRLPRVEADAGVFKKQDAEPMLGVKDGRLQAPMPRKAKVAAHAVMDDTDTQAKIAIIDNILAKAEGILPNKDRPKPFSDKAIQKEVHDPYAIERPRPGQPANAQMGDGYAEGASEDGKKNSFEHPPETDDEQQDESQNSSADEESLLKLLAFKQQELADLRKQLLLEHKRKMLKPDGPGNGPRAKAKEAPAKPFQPLKAQKQEKKAGNAFLPQLRDAAPVKALKAAKNVFLPQGGKQAKPKLAPLIPAVPAKKPLQGPKAQKPQHKENIFLQGKDSAPAEVLKAAKNVFLPPRGKQLKPKLVPLAPAAPLQHPRFEEEASDVFEEHIRKAQKAKVKKLDEQVQPERLLESFEENIFLRRGDDSPGRADNKLMMAGMVKARPAAHLKPDDSLPAALRRRR